MKKTQIIINAILLAGIMALASYHILRKEKTVYVDVGVIMQKYKGMLDARKEFEGKSAQWNANADTLVNDWQTELKSYEKERSRMTKKERELKEELLRNKQQQINQYQEAVKMKIREEEQKLTQNVINRVNDYMNEYGKENGYTFILGANGSGNIVFAHPSRNITDDVLKGLQEEYAREHGK